MLGDVLGDLSVDAREVSIDGSDLPGKLGHQHRPDILGGQDGGSRVSSVDGCLRDAGAIAAGSRPQPRSKPGDTDPAETLWGRVVGQQHKRGLVLRVVERPLLRREVLKHRCSQPVDRAHSVVDHIQPVRGQQPQIDGDLGGDPHGLKVGTHADAGVVSDDAGILRVGLPITAIRRRSVMNDPARVEQLLPVSGEQSNQQRGTAIGEVCRPTDPTVTVEVDDGSNQVEQRSPESPRRVRRLESLGRMESCQATRGRGTPLR